jgi:hypothetical protein
MIANSSAGEVQADYDIAIDAGVCDGEKFRDHYD